MLKGITIQLYEKTQTGVDDFGAPIYSETAKAVDNVLVGEPTSDEVVQALNLYGKRTAYTLALPKGDANEWDNVTVEFFGAKFKTFGDVTQGIDDLIPLGWNKKIKVARYE